MINPFLLGEFFIWKSLLSMFMRLFCRFSIFASKAVNEPKPFRLGPESTFFFWTVSYSDKTNTEYESPFRLYAHSESNVRVMVLAQFLLRIARVLPSYSIKYLIEYIRIALFSLVCESVIRLCYMEKCKGHLNFNLLISQVIILVFSVSNQYFLILVTCGQNQEEDLNDE